MHGVVDLKASSESDLMGIYSTGDKNVQQKIRREFKRRGTSIKDFKSKPEVEIQNEPPKAVISAGKSEISSEVAKEETELKREYKISPKAFREGEYCKVTASYGLTINLGNYESARMDVTVEDFCRPDKINDAWKVLKKKCVDHINAESEKVKAYVKKRNSDKSINQEEGW